MDDHRQNRQKGRGGKQNVERLDFNDEKLMETKRRLEANVFSAQVVQGIHPNAQMSSLFTMKREMDISSNNNNNNDEDEESVEPLLPPPNNATNNTTTNSSDISNMNLSDIRSIPHAETLYLSNQSIERLPRSLFSSHAVHIQQLYLDNNKISQIETLDVPCLRQLKLLQLKRNLLQSIPDTISNLTHLEFLYLDFNQITQLPSTIGGLSELKILSVSHNKISEIGDEIVGCANLQELNLSNNNLTTITMNLHKLSEITKLQLDGNKSLKLFKNHIPTANLFYLTADKPHMSQPYIFVTQDAIIEFVNATLLLCTICHKRQKNSNCVLSACKKCCTSSKVPCQAHGTSKLYKNVDVVAATSSLLLNNLSMQQTNSQTSSSTPSKRLRNNNEDEPDHEATLPPTKKRKQGTKKKITRSSTTFD